MKKLIVSKVKKYSGEYASVRQWLLGLSPRWHENHVSSLDRWLRWLREQGEVWMPDSMVAFQFNAVGQDRFRLLDLLQRWVQGLDVRQQTKQVYYNYIRSFFMHNRCELPRDKGFKIHSDKVKVQGTLTVDEIRRMVFSSNELHQAVYLAMFTGLMGAGELIHFSDHGLDSLMAQLSEGAPLIRVDLPGRKKGRGVRPFYTFLAGDARRALEAWMRVRPPGGSSVFVDQFGHPLTDHGLRFYWRRHLLRLGIIQQDGSGVSSARYGKNLHEMRDVARSRWQKSGADPMAVEFFMGHLIDVNDYNKAFRDVDYARSMYLDAEPWLNIISNDPEKIPRVEHDRMISDLQEAQREVNEAVLRRLEQLERRAS
jgi:hypothetical protein